MTKNHRESRQPKEDNEELRMAHPIFSQDLILEIILDYAIRNNNGASMSSSNICAFRLVQKKWLRVINSVLHKCRHPLFTLVLDAQNSVNGAAHVRENGKLLDRFLKYISKPTCAEDGCAPLFSLIIKEDFFRRENYQSISDCFRQFGHRITDLEISFPLNGGSLPSIFPAPPSFPHLRKFTVYMTDTELEKLAEGETVYTNSLTITGHIHFILSGTEKLKAFIMSTAKKGFPAPVDFQYITLPSSLLLLDITCISGPVHLELLSKSKLPKLEHLRLLIAGVLNEDGLLHQSLDNFKDTLKSLTIYGSIYRGPPRHPIYFRFPEMKKLEYVAMNSIYCELEPGMEQMHKMLPCVKTLLLNNQTPDMFRKWTENSTFDFVETLAVKVVNDSAQRQNHIGYVRNIDLQTMQRILMAFSNVQDLSITISATQTCGLKYMFMEMRRLKSLKIEVVGADGGQNSDFWDALLIGITETLAAGVRVNPDFWNIVNFNNDHLPSIKMLKELDMLSLGANCVAPTPPATIMPLISDLAFHFAFLKMQTLKNLVLQGRFFATDEVTQEWTNQGRNILYKPPQ